MNAHWLQEWGSIHVYHCCFSSFFSMPIFTFYSKTTPVTQHVLSTKVLNVLALQKTYLHSVWIQVLLKLLLVVVVVFWGESGCPDWPWTHYIAKHLLKLCLFTSCLLSAGITKVCHHAWHSSVLVLFCCFGFGFNLMGLERGTRGLSRLHMVSTGPGLWKWTQSHTDTDWHS